MDWTTPIDAYCERLDATFWAEPVNAVTNAAFLIAALVMALRLRGSGLALAWVLTALIATTGVGSFLFHTVARPWAGMLDTLPILAFILTGLFGATRDFLGTSWTVASLVTLGFFPYAAVTLPVFRLIPGIGDSAGYVTVPVLMLIYAGLLWRRAPPTARGLLLTAALLSASITFRALDAPLCGAFPLGTHFLWHLVNAVMLATMVEVYRRHRLRAAGVRDTV